MTLFLLMLLVTSIFIGVYLPVQYKLGYKKTKFAFVVVIMASPFILPQLMKMENVNLDFLSMFSPLLVCGSVLLFSGGCQEFFLTCREARREKKKVSRPCRDGERFEAARRGRGNKEPRPCRGGGTITVGCQGPQKSFPGCEEPGKFFCFPLLNAWSVTYSLLCSNP